MANDWLKIEENMTDKPEVARIGAILGIESDSVAGKLIRVWAWATRNCCGDGATNVAAVVTLDRIAGVCGFCDAMIAVGWLLVDGDEMRFPNFGRHCSKTAKERAESARRMAKSRDGGCADVADKPQPQPQPEKSTEKNKEYPPTPHGGDGLNGANGTDPPGGGGDWLDELWAAAPAPARTRSSRHKVRKAWDRIPAAQRPPPLTVIAALAGWKRCWEWKRDDGQFVPALDRWLRDRRWAEVPEDGKAAVAGSRARLPTKPLPVVAPEDLATPEDIAALSRRTNGSQPQPQPRT